MPQSPRCCLAVIAIRSSGKPNSRTEPAAARVGKPSTSRDASREEPNGTARKSYPASASTPPATLCQTAVVLSGI